MSNDGSERELRSLLCSMRCIDLHVIIRRGQGIQNRVTR